MPPNAGLPLRQAPTSISPKNSSTPLISSEERAEAADVESQDLTTGKKSIFGLGKRRDEKAAQQKSISGAATATMSPTVPAPLLPSTAALWRPSAEDSKTGAQGAPLSPPRHPSHLRSSSPRLHSPASSEIFERSVQEPVHMSNLQNESTPAHMPAHMLTEDMIPPALEASVEAITDKRLDPDEVEIVMSSSHQPAAATVLESSASHADLSQVHSRGSARHLPRLEHQRSDASGQQSMQQSGFLPTATDADETASNYGQLDPNDLRRLSFISFADVVQAEHQQQHQHALASMGSRDSLYMGGSHFAQTSAAGGADRAASPLRSPRSPSHSLSGGLTTPPPGKVGRRVMEQSPARNVSGQHGELHIETMRQAVRKTASGDLGGGRGAGMSPTSNE